MESFATLIKSRKVPVNYTDQLLNPEQVEMILKAALIGTGFRNEKYPGQLLSWRIRKCWPSCQYANRQVLRS